MRIFIKEKCKKENSWIEFTNLLQGSKMVAMWYSSMHHMIHMQFYQHQHSPNLSVHKSMNWQPARNQKGNSENASKWSWAYIWKPKKGSSNVIMLHMLTINFRIYSGSWTKHRKVCSSYNIFTLRYEHLKVRLSQRRDSHKGFKFSF